MWRERWNPAGKLAIVTGASSGIGFAIAQRLVVSGAKVIAVARRTDRLESLQKSVSDQQGEVFVCAGDITEPKFREVLIQETKRIAEKTAGSAQLGLLVNAAGIGALGTFATASEDRMRRVFEVNFFGATELTRLALPLLLEHPDSIVCNIGSVLGHLAVPLKSEYVASKFALLGWSNALRAELASTTVHVTVVSPSTTATEFFDVAMDAKPNANWNRFGAMSADAVAAETMQALTRRRREVILSRGGRFLVWLNRLCPPLYASLIARMGARS